MNDLENHVRDAPYGSPERTRADEEAKKEAQASTPPPPSFWQRLLAVTDKKERDQLIIRVRNKTPRKEHIAQDTLNLFATIVRLAVSIIGPVFSALSIWISVVGIAFTIFSGIEPFIQLAHWVRFITIKWRNFTHSIWDIIGPYIGFEIPIDLKDFATFVSILSIALVLGFLSNGKRLVVYESLVGLRMAIYGISHAINTSKSDLTPQDTKTALQLLFFEINNFLAKHLKTFFVYSVPFLTVFNLTVRIGLIFIPMVILVPEQAFAEFFNVRATRVEYLFLSACISHLAALIALTSGLLHIVLHFIRATHLFLRAFAFKDTEVSSNEKVNRFKKARTEAKFGLTYASSDPIRRVWLDQFFLARFSAALIRSNWIWFPISTAEVWHRKFDPFLWLSERRFADPAFVDRIAKGLFLFFILYGLNWVSINAENIANLFEPPTAEQR